MSRKTEADTRLEGWPSADRFSGLTDTTGRANTEEKADTPIRSGDPADVRPFHTEGCGGRVTA